jgi:hypothetical protein
MLGSKGTGTDGVTPEAVVFPPPTQLGVCEFAANRRKRKRFLDRERAEIVKRKYRERAESRAVAVAMREDGSDMCVSVAVAEGQS